MMAKMQEQQKGGGAMPAAAGQPAPMPGMPSSTAKAPNMGLPEGRSINTSLNRIYKFAICFSNK